jgi:hypothetical protein
VGVDGHGGSGVLEQAVSITAANTAEAFQGINREGDGVGAETGDKESEDPRGTKECMVMVFLPTDARQGAFVTEMLPAWVPLVVSAYIPLQRAYLTGGAALWSRGWVVV